MIGHALATPHDARPLRCADAHVQQLMRRLSTGHVRRLSVIDGQARLVGAVTLEDLARALGGRSPLRVAATVLELSAPAAD